MCVRKRKPLLEKIVGDIVGFNSGMNQHIGDSRMGDSTCKFPMHVYKYGLKNKCLNETFFKINTMMKLKSSNQLETYQNYFHKKGYDTLNCSEHLKK